jgi:hypothetical protein
MYPDRPPLLVRCKPMPDEREMFHRRQRIKWYYTGLSKVIVNNNGRRSFFAAVEKQATWQLIPTARHLDLCKASWPITSSMVSAY